MQLRLHGVRLICTLCDAAHPACPTVSKARESIRSWQEVYGTENPELCIARARETYGHSADLSWTHSEILGRCLRIQVHSDAFEQDVLWHLPAATRIWFETFPGWSALPRELWPAHMVLGN